MGRFRGGWGGGGGGGGGAGGLDPPMENDMVIGFLKNTGTDPPRSYQYVPVKYLDD